MLYRNAMRKLLAGLVAVLSLSLVTVQISVAAVTPGSKCTKVGATSTYNGKKYTCVKSGKKLVWNKGVALPKPVPIAIPTPSPIPTQTVAPVPTASATPAPSPASSDLVFSNLCEKDPLVPEEWSLVQNWSRLYMGCARPYRYVSAQLPLSQPTSLLTDPLVNSNVDLCKIPYVGSWPHENLGYQKDSNRFRPTKSSVIQVVPIQFTNAKATTNPKSDYGKLLNFLSDFLVNISDVPISPQIRFHNEYIDLGKTIETYKLNDEHSDMTEFQRDIITKSDPLIDYSGVDQIIIVGPPDLNGTFTYHMNWYSRWQTSEGIIKSAYQVGSIALTPRIGSVWSPDPWITVHEAIGHQLGMMDLLGSASGGRKKIWEYSGKSLGSGFWGQMSGAYGDFLIWQKWITGLIYDDQVACLRPGSYGNFLIRPAEIKGRYLKTLMIPLPNKQVIVVESIRSVGYNFKMPKKAEGALVYVVDVNETQNDYGAYVQVPPNRNSDLGAERIDATLRVGDSVTVDGYKITVVESGDFGDVVKVEKA